MGSRKQSSQPEGSTANGTAERRREVDLPGFSSPFLSRKRKVGENHADQLNLACVAFSQRPFAVEQCLLTHSSPRTKDCCSEA